ncbi:DUF397 domain-containing protein [Spongiactinospora gelatinilytica]|uniref:DUF397 domain-containing protein n=1 Tax=Spongiactinospora gelatinilytica TaxID=2666298 RepID=A0A2W2HKT2_9ACTN|nr:DUF397 domain-containing protein [Spongiactinospora gelatinilytica]PZG39604.1 DUF397 domain-containing protein [Spongiactinospora gelatinilytica]
MGPLGQETPIWRKATASGGNGGECVEVATNIPGTILIRDSKNPTGPTLRISPTDWTDFISQIKDGR